MAREIKRPSRDGPKSRIRKQAEDVSSPIIIDLASNVDEGTTPTTALSGGTPAETSLPLPLIHSEDMGRHVKLGLTIAGAAAAVLSSVFSIFQVDVFLRAYHLPLRTYSKASAVFSILHTGNDLVGAWVVDNMAAKRTMSRNDMIGIAGCLFSLCSLTPFFRWTQPSGQWWDGFHFVASLSVQDTMFSFIHILMGSALTDNTSLTDNQRVQFMASGKVANLIASFATGRIGLALFDVDDLFRFRVFLLFLAVVTSGMFILAQVVIYLEPTSSFSWRRMRLRSNAASSNKKPTSISLRGEEDSRKRTLQWRSVAYDFWTHRNFRAWIVMEMLLEAQVSFNSFFLKTFVDQLLITQGISQATGDWIVSINGPIRHVMGIFAYIPIRRIGYPRVYTALFVANICLACAMLALAEPSMSPYWTLAFLMTYPVLTGAVQSSGFHLAMSDLVMEMKRRHALQGRLNEPSLAGLFMGATKLFCRPVQVFLPVIAASALEKIAQATEEELGVTEDGDNLVEEEAQDQPSNNGLFYVLVVPPLVCSVIQIMAWSCFDLTPRKTAEMREEITKFQGAALDEKRHHVHDI